MANRSEGKSMLVAAFWLSMVAAAFLAVTNAGNYDYAFKVDREKSNRCHYPSIHDCNSSLYPILEFNLSNWFYHQPFQACRPLYTGDDGENCKTNKDLPVTREECERICGEPCTGINKEDGVCTLEELCEAKDRIRTENPRPCNAYGVKCCARSIPGRPVKAYIIPEPTADNFPIPLKENTNNIDNYGTRFRYQIVPPIH